MLENEKLKDDSLLTLQPKKVESQAGGKMSHSLLLQNPSLCSHLQKRIGRT